MGATSGQVTQLLAEMRQGRAEAESRLLEVVYDELHRMAANYMRRERADHTLQATALVNEAWMRLVDQRDKDWQNRAHFFGVAGQVMRRVLVDHARAWRAGKRGGPQKTRLSLEDLPLTTAQSDELIALDEALSRLALIDARQCRVVELRFFAGLTEEETARILGVAARTVKRDWRVARAWLYGEMKKAAPGA